MTKITSTLTALLLLILMACTNEKETMLVGTWEAVSWIVDGQESNRHYQNVKMNFSENGEYSAVWGERTEKGVFEVRDNNLYTTEEGKMKKMVAIHFSGPDTLLIEMNRQGTQEHMVLLKK